ncbi:MAG: hypothetical protein J6D36_08040, partial [Erysipelotrichaceae bacterium]|nr:hypothetical protein [Erysipelotrichaceae bacterium]
DIRNAFLELSSLISDNTLFFEVLFWGLAIVFEKSQEQFDAISVDQITHDIFKCEDIPCFWNNISVEKNEFTQYFESLYLSDIA